MLTGRTPYGLRYALKRRTGSSVAYVALTIRCGTRDEAGFPGGTAHFTEHTIFKGTALKSASRINSCLEKVGGDLNAYTNKEEIVIHATVLKEDVSKAARLLFELARMPSFPETEIETEKGVVIEEIHSYKDSHADDIFDRFEEMLFKGHPLGGLILGSAATVRKISPSMLKDFIKTRFTPDRMAISVVADIDEKKLEASLLKDAMPFFPDSPSSPAPDSPMTAPEPSLTTEYRMPEPLHFNKTIDKRSHEADVIIGGLAPSLYETKERTALNLLGNILGGPGSNSLLNTSLREKHGWVYGIETWYNRYAETGSFGISFGCDKSNIDKCFREIDKICTKVREKPFSPTFLKAAKKQLFGQMAISSDFGETSCLSMGKNMISFNRIAPNSEILEAFEAITPDDLCAIAAKILDPGRLSTLVYL